MEKKKSLKYRILKIKDSYRIEKRCLFFFWEEMWQDIAIFNTKLTLSIDEVYIDNRKIRFETYDKAYKFYKTFVEPNDIIYHNSKIRLYPSVDGKANYWIHKDYFFISKHPGFEYNLYYRGSKSKESIKRYIDTTKYNQEIITL